MTKVTFFKRNGVYYGFRETGHTGYGESGDDILCSALSAMTMLIINTIEISYASDVEYTIDEDTGSLRFTVPQNITQAERHDADVVLNTMLCGLMDLYEQYSDYINLEVI